MATPTFLLKGINIVDITNKYLRGECSNRKVGAKHKMLVNNVVLETNIGTNAESEVYEFIDWSNSRQRVVTINHGLYNEFKTNVINSNPKVCHHCRCIIIGDPIGIPIRMEQHRNWLDPSTTATATTTTTKKKLTVYHVQGLFHSFNCAYAIILKEYKLSFKIRDPNYCDAETLLLHMFYSMYPNKKLKPAPDWKLLNINGGPLTQEEFDKGMYNFVRSPNLVLVPLKIEYHHCGLLS